MEISFLDKYNKIDSNIMHIYSSSQTFKDWQQKYMQQQLSDPSFKVQIFYYTQSIKEIPPEQKQFLQSQHSQSIHSLKFQFNLSKLSSADELNIRFLLKSLTSLQKISFSALFNQVQSSLAKLIMESGLAHLQNINILKFQNSFFSTTEFSQFLRNLHNLQKLQLTIPDNADIESNIITESQNLSHLNTYKITFGQEGQHSNINPEQILQIPNMNDKHSSLVDIVMNQIIEMQNLNKLVLNISGRLKGEEQIKLLNSCLSHKKHLKNMQIDLSYHKIAYNIANIIQLDANIQTLKLNCSSSYNFSFEEIELNQIQKKQRNENNNSCSYDYSHKNNLENNKDNCQCNIQQKENHKNINDKINDQNNPNKYCNIQFQFTQLQKLHLKLNFTKSDLVNSLFSFLHQQKNLSKTLKNIHLEVSFVQKSICIQTIGHFLSKMQSLETIVFRCHSDQIENRDNIYLLRQISKIKSLKELTFNMKVQQIDSDYCELLQYFNQRCTKLDINLYINIGLIQINRKSLIIYPITQEILLYSVIEMKKQTNILSYLINCFQNNKQLQKVYLQFSNITNQSNQEVSQFIASLSTLEQMEELNLAFVQFNILDIKYVLKQLANILPNLQLLKVLQVQNRHFQQSNFKEEYQKLLVTSISSNLYLKNINLENYSNQTYEDYQLLYLQNLLNVKSKYSKKLIPQIRSLQKNWSQILRKDIISDLATQFLI
ncbi:hypothetical protein ABPG74_019046 [Tetrahymena malaccensis]